MSHVSNGFRRSLRKTVIAVGLLAIAVVPISRATAATPSSVTQMITASVTPLDGGGSNYAYALPDGSEMNVPAPPINFDPLTASAAQLAEYDFPPRPTDAINLNEWTTAMEAYKSDAAPTSQLSIDWNNPEALRYITYGSWAGFGDGTKGVTNTTYVGLKGDITVPSHSGTCSSNNGIGIWIGLGGTTGSSDLVQQGIECGNSNVGSGGDFRPFTEFANTQDPIVFCSQTTWTFPAGDTLYQNMSYYTSTNEANFYLEDVTTGVSHSCSIGEPTSGWSFNGGTAEWIVEAPGSSPSPLDFSSISFSDANALLNSTGLFVTLGSQGTPIKFVEGDNATTYCFSPSAIGADNQSFSVSWNSSTCY